MITKRIYFLSLLFMNEPVLLVNDHIPKFFVEFGEILSHQGSRTPKLYSLQPQWFHYSILMIPGGLYVTSTAVTFHLT